MSKSTSIILQTVVFLLAATICAHLLFSWMGYNPTDDGFTLAYSRRILDGQIPHRDFIIIRPYYSPLIHIPFLVWCGESLMWWSRAFVWFQFAMIAWIWTVAWFSTSDRHLNPLELVPAAFIAFFFNAYHWPIMPWHTVDGLMFIALALPCVRSDKRLMKSLGYVLLGTACLCKQSFIFAPPLFLLITGDWKRPVFWLSALAPALTYGLVLQFTGALPFAIDQFVSHVSLEKTITRFQRTMFASTLAVFLGLRWVFGTSPSWPFTRRRNLQATLGLALILAVPVFVALKNLYTSRSSIAAFHLSSTGMGMLLFYVIEHTGADGKRDFNTRERIRILIMMLTAGWCTAVSVGAAVPGLVMGLFTMALLEQVFSFLRRPAHRSAVFIMLATLVFICFRHDRETRVYMEMPAEKLTCPLDGIVRGAKGISTNPRTFAFLKDLNRAVEKAKTYGDPYAIVPDCPGYWATADESNPLPIDWCKNTELASPSQYARVIDSIEAQQDHLTLIVQKHQAFRLPRGFLPLVRGRKWSYRWREGTEKFAVAYYVTQNFTKVTQTKHFEIYREYR